MTTTKNKTLGALLAARLNLQARATEYVPEDNPFAGKSVDDLASGAGYPAVNMAEKTNGAAMAQALEEGRTGEIRKAKDVTVAKRVAQHRAREAKRLAFEEVDLKDYRPDPERMTMAWRVVFPLVPIVTRIANGKKRWAERYLGGVVDDVAQVVLERMALMIAKQERYDLSLLIEAADELGAQAERKGIPGDQRTDDERKHERAKGKARKWLMGMVNNRVQGTLVDLYTESRNLRWDNLDIIATVMTSINGPGEDPLVNAHKASRAPGFLGTRFQRPEGIDQGLVATAINAAITERGLDPITEILLNEENRRSNGSVAWSKVAEAIFLATPNGMGEHLWDLVQRATEHHDRPKRARADAVRTHVRNLFEWLPGFIVAVVESMDPHTIGWASQPDKPVYATDDEPTSGLATVRLITGTSVVAAPNRAFDGATDTEGVHWPMTGGRPVGDGVGAELREVEEVVVPWRTRGSKVRRAWRTEAIMASDFELGYLADEPEQRLLLQPALRYASVEEAVEALTKHIDVLTGADLVNGLVNA